MTQKHLKQKVNYFLWLLTVTGPLSGIMVSIRFYAVDIFKDIDMDALFLK